MRTRSSVLTRVLSPLNTRLMTLNGRSPVPAPVQLLYFSFVFHHSTVVPGQLASSSYQQHPGVNMPPEISFIPICHMIPVFDKVNVTIMNIRRGHLQVTDQMMTNIHLDV